MRDIILQFPSQFSYQPNINNREKLPVEVSAYIVGGMGGSHLSADLLKMVNKTLDIEIVSDYQFSNSLSKETLFIASSFSGNTAEVIYLLNTVLENSIPVLIVSSDGNLIKTAIENKLPYIELPDKNLQPRMALGYSLRALMKAVGDENGLKDTSDLARGLNPEIWENQGKSLAEKMRGRIPVIYSSSKNRPLAYIWKIKFNENSKIPAFYNVFPELNHNELEGWGYDLPESFLKDVFYFIFIKDNTDYKENKKRMDLTGQILANRGLSVEFLNLKGDSVWEAVFNNIILSDWTSYYLSRMYRIDSEKVDFIEKFKKML